MPFVKGQSGNPAGKPKGARSFTTKVRDALMKIADGKETTYERLLIQSILDKAIYDKDNTMMKVIWEQLDGKPLQRMGNADGSNIECVTNINYLKPSGNNIKTDNKTRPGLPSAVEQEQ